MEQEYIKYIFCIYYPSGYIRFRLNRRDNGTITYLLAKLQKDNNILQSIIEDCKNKNINITNNHFDMNFKIGNLNVIMLANDYIELSNLVFYDINPSMAIMEPYKLYKLSEELLFYIQNIIPLIPNIIHLSMNNINNLQIILHI